MGNEKIVILSVLITAVIAAVVFTSSHGIEESEPISPPTMLMEVDGEVVHGLEGDFCWTTDGETACVDKLEPEQLSTRLAIMAEDVEQNATYRFYPLNHTRPDRFNVSVLSNEGELLAEHEYEEDGIQLSLEPGTYLLVTRGSWPQGNVTHVFQVKVGGEDLLDVE